MIDNEQDDDLLEEQDEEKDETEDGDDFEIPEEGEFVVPQMTRKEKKRNRFAEQIRRAEEAERENARLQAELDATRRYAAPPPAPPPQQEDPFERQIQEAETNRTQLFEAYNNAVAAAGKDGLSKQTQDEYLRRARELDAKLTDLRVDRRIAATQSASAGDPAKVMVRARHMDVFSHPLAADEAKVAYKRATSAKHLGGEGRPDNLETLDSVMDEVRQRYKLGNFRHGGQPVDPSDARRYGGVPRGTGAPTKQAQGYRMTEVDREMADMAFPHLPPKERYQLFAKDMGKKQG